MALKLYDVVIVGGGPAGLSAALMLGRCRRKVLLFDDGRYRNAYSHSMHGFLTRDGIDPADLRKIARKQLLPYKTVEVQEVKVINSTCHDKGFKVTLENGKSVLCKKLLLATGLCDTWPTMKGAEELYGKSIFHCPYCDGWEIKDQPFAALGKGDDEGGALALELTLWSKDVVLCTDGPSKLSKEYKARLKRHHIKIREERIVELISKNGKLNQIVFEKGEPLKRAAIFFCTKCPQRSNLPTMMNCEFDKDGGVKVGKYETTNIPGLYVIGDASVDVFFAVVGASEGVEAAVAINKSLLKKETK